MSEKFRIRAGTQVYESEIGHNNFFYPSKKTVIVTEDCEAEKLNWIGSNKLTPYKVRLSALGHDGAWDNFAVVWVMNELIKKGATRFRQGNKEE